MSARTAATQRRSPGWRSTLAPTWCSARGHTSCARWSSTAHRLIAYSLGNFSGFHNFATDGVLAASAVLHVPLDGPGAFRSGRITSVRLDEAGSPSPTRSGGRAV